MISCPLLQENTCTLTLTLTLTLTNTYSSTNTFPTQPAGDQ